SSDERYPLATRKAVHAAMYARSNSLAMPGLLLVNGHNGNESQTSRLHLAQRVGRNQPRGYPSRSVTRQLGPEAAASGCELSKGSGNACVNALYKGNRSRWADRTGRREKNPEGFVEMLRGRPASPRLAVRPPASGSRRGNAAARGWNLSGGRRRSC